MYCKYVWLTLIISDTREAVKRWSNFTASFSKTSCKKAKLLHKIEMRYRSHKFVFRRPTLSHAYLKTAFGAILRNNANIWRLHTSTNERGQVIMPYFSHLKKEKIEINNPSYVQKCTTRTLDTSYWTKLFLFSIWRHVWQNCLHFVEGLGKGHFVMPIMSPHVRESKFRKSGKLLLVESGIREGFSPAIRNTAQGLRNPTSPAAGCVAD